MADDYKQYTSCCLPQQWRSLATYLVSATATLLAVAIVTIAVAGWCALFYLGVAAAAEAVAACSWWLNIRLVCLGGDRSAAGMLVAIEPAVGKSGYFNELDTDYSINLLLYPNLPGVSQAEAEISHPYGELIKNQQDIIDHIGFFEGYKATEEPRRKPDRTSAVLHAEFEGAGVYDFFIGASISLGLYIAAIIACAAIPPPWGVLLAGLLALLALLAWFLSHEVGAGDYGGPGDVKGAPSELHTNDPATSIGSRRMPSAPNQLITLPSGRKPIARPTAIMIATAIRERTRSVIVLAASTAHDVIGKERKRSMMPFLRSCASNTPDQIMANVMRLHEDAGHQEVDVGGALGLRLRRRTRSGRAARTASAESSRPAAIPGLRMMCRKLRFDQRQDVAHPPGDARATFRARTFALRSRSGGPKGRYSCGLLRRFIVSRPPHDRSGSERRRPESVAAMRRHRVGCRSIADRWK